MIAYELKTTDNFKSEAKRLLKKFASLRKEIEALKGVLSEDPETGTPIGNGFYKIRLAIRSKGKGKRGGARVITLVRIVSETIYLVSIYDKSEQADISGKELEQLLSESLPDE